MTYKYSGLVFYLSIGMKVALYVCARPAQHLYIEVSHERV